MPKHISITKGLYAIVDDEDFEYLSQWTWFALKSRDKYYAARWETGKGNNRKTILMHRVVNNTPDNLVTDHIDNNTLNNQRNNLRSVTTSENRRNIPKPKTNTSGYKGVSWDKDSGKWVVHVTTNGKRRKIGRYKTKGEAVQARDSAYELYHGSHKNLQ